MSLRGILRLAGTIPVLLLFLSLQVNAQVGTIAGLIVDGENGETLIGATATIDGSTLGDATDLNGRYEFIAEPGTYTMKFAYLGFSTVMVENVVVVAGEITRIEIELLPEALSYGEVVITADAIEGSEAGLLRERAKSVAVSDAHHRVNRLLREEAMLGIEVDEVEASKHAY